MSTNELALEYLNHKDTRYQRHGLTGDTKRRIFEALFQVQQGRCPICSVSQDDISRKFQIDHCHATGRIRGLLCPNCNSKLGMVESYGMLQDFLDPGFKHTDESWFHTKGVLVWTALATWLEKHRETIPLYLQEDILSLLEEV